MSSSQEFIAAIEPQRDALYARARRATTDTRTAEAALLSAVRKAFSTLAAADPVAAIVAELPPAAETPLPESDTCMPADTWARLTAAVQVEAAKSAGGSGLNPGHVLLTPDPLLAPKARKRVHEPQEGLGFTPTARFLIAAIVALLLGLALTTVILTRQSASPTQAPATRP